MAEKLLPGSLDYFKGDDVVIVGAGLAAKLGLRVGGEITLLAPKGNVTPFGTTPRVKTYRIISVFRVGNTLYDNNYLFMPLEEAQAYFNYGDTVNGIEVMLTDPDSDLALLPALTKAAGPTARAVPWQDINSAFFEAIQVEANVMFLILSLIILVAALNIISGLIMLVKDKSPDIAILRTMGATRGAVMRIFFIAGASIGVTGTMLGFAIGRSVLRQYRKHPPGPVQADRHAAVRSHRLFPLPHAGRDGSRRGGVGGGDGAGADLPGHAVSVLAGGAARSGRGAAV